MSCSEVCPERESQDVGISPGIIDNDEEICRGAYAPNHGRYPKIQNGFISKKDFLNGQLSAWRASEKVQFDFSQVRDCLRNIGADGTELTAVGVVRASLLRSILTTPDGCRAVCLRDECDMDRHGGKHRAHCHIAPCKQTFSSKIDSSTVEFVQLWSDIRLIFKNGMRPV